MSPANLAATPGKQNPNNLLGRAIRATCQQNATEADMSVRPYAVVTSVRDIAFVIRLGVHVVEVQLCVQLPGGSRKGIRRFERLDDME